MVKNALFQEIQTAANGSTSPAAGIAGGSLVALGASGWVVKLFGWRWIFWGGGILALAWTPLWLFLVRNSPEQHPLISRAELELLADTLHVKPRVSSSVSLTGTRSG